jgi:HSP20 family protein
MTPFGREPMGDVWSDRLWPEWPWRQGEEFEPSFNLYEKDGNVHLTAELPGVNKDDISIDVQDDILTISGKKESSKEEEGANYYLKESSYGSFSRSFKLPGPVEGDQVDASFKDGVLRLKAPIKESAKSRRIQIKG